MSCGYLTDDAVKYSNLAAGVVVGKIGAASASIVEIIEYESNLQKSRCDANVKSCVEVAILAGEFRERGATIVFTSGSFDISDVGHVRFF